jgi:hypothetical protein
MIHRFFALVFAGLLILAAPNAARVGAAESQGNEPRANAWAVSVALPSAGQVVQIGQSSSASGSRPTATAAALNIGGQGTGIVVADLNHPDVVKDAQTFSDPEFPVCTPALGDQQGPICDPGGNMTLRGGFAEAHASGTSTSAAAGIASGTGNGFAFASKNFTFDQQSQVLNAIQQLDDAIFTPINSLIDSLAPALNNNGVQLPHLSGIPPAGLIDIVDVGGASGRTQTSASPGFNSAQASASMADVKVLGGFIDLHNVKASAVSESNSGTDNRDANATIGGITIAGLDVVANQDGLDVATNDPVKRAALQPALDLLLSALQQAGMTITVSQTKAMKDLREATAFELSWVTPGGLLNISIGHADASAASVGAPVALGPESNFPPPSGGAPPPPTVSGVNPPAVGGPTGPAPSVAPSTTTRNGPVVRSLGPAAARAIRTAYLIFLVTGFVASLGYPMFVRRHWSRRAIRRTVLA